MPGRAIVPCGSGPVAGGVAKCRTATLTELTALEEDLAAHIHLEDDVLFAQVRALA